MANLAVELEGMLEQDTMIFFTAICNVILDA